MKSAFAKSVAAAAAAGLLSVACGGGAPEAEVPATPAPAADGDMGMDEAGDEMGDEMGAEGESVDGEKACCKGMNECKGKGGCKVEGKHDCQGNNECKGNGGCNGHCPKGE